MAITATHTAPKIVGKALYLELVANPALDSDEQRKVLGWQFNGTRQVLVFPEYQDDTGKIHAPVVMERTLTSYSPRAQWNTSHMTRNAKPLDLESSEWNGYSRANFYTTEEWNELTEKAKHDSRKLTLELHLRRELITLKHDYSEGSNERITTALQGWVVREGKPISVEITDQDMNEVHKDRKTPQAVIRRINKVRGTLDKFPAKLA